MLRPSGRRGFEQGAGPGGGASPVRPAWPSRGVIASRRAGQAASLCPQPQGRTVTSASPASHHPPTPGHGCASRSTPGRNASPTQAPRTQGPFAQRTEPLRHSRGPHRSRPPLPVQVEMGVPGGSGVWDPALPCAPFWGIEPFSGQAVGLQRWAPCGSGPCPPLPASRGHGDQEADVLLRPWTREPGFLGGNCTCHLSPSARPDPDTAVGPGWLGRVRRDKASAARAGCRIGLTVLPQPRHPAPRAGGTSPGRQD